MGMLIRSQALLEIDIRIDVGSPDTTLLTAVELTRCLTKSLERMNELCPRWGLASITTVADQQDYKIWDAGADPGTTEWIENVNSVMDVMYDPAGTSSFNDEFYSISGIGTIMPFDSGLSIWDDPSLVEIYFRKLREFRKRFGGKGELFEDQANNGFYIRLIPKPSDADIIIPFQYTQARLLADCESKYENRLIDLAVGHCLKITGKKLNMAPEVRHAGRTTKVNGDSDISDGNDKIKDAENRMRRVPRARF